MSVINVTAANFDEVIGGDKKVLLDFFATWCGPCQMVSPIVDEIADEHPEYTVGKIDTDDEPELAAKFGVMSVPTLVVLQDKKLVSKTVGKHSKADILKLLEG